MSIRDVTQTETKDTSRVQRLVRVLITEGRIFALWRVELQSGQRNEVSVPVSDSLQALVEARASYQNFIDNVRDDTIGRTGA